MTATDMAYQEHLQLLTRNVVWWNRWRRDCRDVKPDLRAANLSGAHLSRANLSGADLREADLHAANLTHANLRDADLTSADLSTADLNGADLSDTQLTLAALTRADLSNTELFETEFVDADLEGASFREASAYRANFRGASLVGADFCDAVLRSVDFSGAQLHDVKLSETVFDNVNLSNAKGLQSCDHYGPTALDARTLLRSGELPLAFLRGCGLPDILIDYLPSLTARPVQFYSCFISYSVKDQPFAERLHADLQAKGIRCWFAPRDMSGGKKVHEQIDAAIRIYDRLLLIISPHSMQSEWVRTEIAKARKRELREHRQMLFPIRLIDFESLSSWECFDSDIGKDSAREIREYFVPDFSNWKDHDCYQRALADLVRDLQAKEAVAAAHQSALSTK